MMGSMMADLKGVHSGINLILRGKNEPELSIDDLLVMLFDEVEYVWPKLGYPPLVTPFSQYVKNVALMNVMSLIKGEERWTMIDNHTWDMILGKSGRLPGALAPEIIALAKEKGITRTQAGIRMAAEEHPEALYVFGNAPTALMELCDLIRKEKAHPCGIIAAPVGFVHVCESKHMVKPFSHIPKLIVEGRKGGSNLAATLVNAILTFDDAEQLKPGRDV